MADFVAVIRRTVDGLSDNVPEMRAKVYDKARSAVRRQLENMTPRPSDDMIERQMLKLETAIQEVEDDHAVALPPEDEPAVTDSFVANEPPVAEDAPPEFRDAEAAAEPEPAQPEPLEPDPVEEPSAQVSDGDTLQPVAEPDRETELSSPDVVEDAPDHGGVVQDDHADADQSTPMVVATDSDEPETAEAVQTFSEPEPSEPEPSEPELPEVSQELEPIVPAVEPVSVAREPDLADATEDSRYPTAVEPVEIVGLQPMADADHADEPVHVTHVDSPATAEAVETVPFVEPESVVEPIDEPRVDEPAARDEAADREEPADETVQPATGWELPEWNTPATEPVVHSEPVPVAAHVEPVWHEPAHPVEMEGPLPDLLHDDAALRAHPDTIGTDDLARPDDPAKGWDFEDKNPFGVEEPAPADPTIAAWGWPVEKPVDETAGPRTGVSSNWEEVDHLLNEGGAATAAAATARETSFVPGEGPQARPISYRVEPKRSRFPVKGALLTVMLALLAGGSGYAYWQNQQAVNSWVSDMVASVTSSGPPAASTPATTGSAATQTGEGAQSAPDVAAATNTKFTQRLQADGSELDSGPAPAINTEASAEEGKSVAPQTEASKPVETAQSQPVPATETPAAGTAAPATTPPVETPPASATVIPAGAQKMFLYEERLGQSAPTAIEGTVVWSVKDEAPEAGQRPEPVINAQINVPDRGLTALMTIKRNADSSLPASHVIEFVFSLPANFEGGSIDSVQRVSMKRTEQDRGDALIAVPAKITEDFHMIALNDFPEAVTTNVELLRTRPWIDIPLTYRNGRRALLTMEKGKAGTEAFTKALQAWPSAPTPAANP